MGAFKLGYVFIGHFDLALLILIVILLIVMLLFCRSLAWSCTSWFFLPNITLISEDDHAHIGAAVLLDFLQPAVHVVETFLVCQIKNNKNSISPLVIGFCYCSIPFLTGRVPYLQANCALVNLQGSKSEIDSNCCHVILLELVILWNNDKKNELTFDSWFSITRLWLSPLWSER